MNDIRKGKRFSAWECNILIYALELKTVLFGQQDLWKNVYSPHILLLTGNTSAVAATNKIDSTKSLGMDQVIQKNVELHYVK